MLSTITIAENNGFNWFFTIILTISGLLAGGFVVAILMKRNKI